MQNLQIKEFDTDLRNVINTALTERQIPVSTVVLGLEKYLIDAKSLQEIVMKNEAEEIKRHAEVEMRAKEKVKSPDMEELKAEDCEEDDYIDYGNENTTADVVNAPLHSR